MPHRWDLGEGISVSAILLLIRKGYSHAQQIAYIRGRHYKLLIMEHDFTLGSPPQGASLHLVTQEPAAAELVLTSTLNDQR